MTRAELNGLFHRLWTRDVGQPGYDKSAWQALELALFYPAIEQAARALNDVGHTLLAEHENESELASTWAVFRENLAFAEKALALPAEAAPAAAQLRAGTWHSKTCVSAPFCACADREIERLTRERDETRAAAAQPPPDLARRVEELERVLTDLRLGHPCIDGQDCWCATSNMPEWDENQGTYLHEHACDAARAALAGAAQPQGRCECGAFADDLHAALAGTANCAADLLAGAAQPQAEGAPARYDMSIHDTPDAAAWARFFCETFPEGSPSPSEGTMLGWFANAMMAMHDHLKRAAAPRPETPPPSHYADCNSRIGLECNCGAAPRPSTDKEGAP